LDFEMAKRAAAEPPGGIGLLVYLPVSTLLEPPGTRAEFLFFRITTDKSTVNPAAARALPLPGQQGACLQMASSVAHSGVMSAAMKIDALMRNPIGIITIEIKGPPAGG